MMASITRFLQNVQLELFHLGAKVLLAGVFHTAVCAQVGTPEIRQFQLESSAEGVYASTVVEFELAEQVEDALAKGVPIYFVAQADLMQERWYWSNKKIAAVERHMRLAYQALTRKWRLTTAPGAFSGQGLGLALGQSFDNLSDALAAIKRFNRWQISDAAELAVGVQYQVNFRFQLDVSQLPRPLQIGTLGQADWSMAVSTRQSLVRDAVR